MDLGEEVGVLVSSPEVVVTLEQCVMNWQAQITIIIEEQLKKRPQVCGAVSSPPFRLQATYTTMSQLFRRPSWSLSHRVSVWLCALKAPGPIAEIDFWRERSAILSALSEQLNLPAAKRIVEVLTQVDPVTVQNLELSVAELNSYCVEAGQNVRFLSTLERHFKVSHFPPTSRLLPRIL
jgi:dynein heavy chain